MFRDRHLKKGKSQAGLAIMTILFVGLVMIMLASGCERGVDGGKDRATEKITQERHGALPVHELNRRYFTDGNGRPVYLTGSHHWNNLLDRSGKPTFDYPGYLDFLVAHNHNFIRLWAWENAVSEPLPYQRTGPGSALDGSAKFDLNKLDPSYFDRLRSRVVAAGERGIYVMVMLFQGFSVHHKGGDHANPWDRHPFQDQNNISEINGDKNGNGEGEEVHTLQIPDVTKIQEAYVKKVVDTLNDLDNVLYEISNESHKGSVAWQYHMIRFIQEYQKGKPKQHPVVMTFLWDGGDDNGMGNNAELFASPADAISPGRGPRAQYQNNPPPADGSKVIIVDTDHLWGVGGNEDWVWKSFFRGLNPIFMDPIEDPKWKSVRRSMGQTLTVSKRINLAKMAPAHHIASSGYSMANPGAEYLVYIPSDRRDESRSEKKFKTRPLHSVDVDLSRASGKFDMQWFNPTADEFSQAGIIEGGARRALTLPFEGPAILHLTLSEK